MRRDTHFFRNFHSTHITSVASLGTGLMLQLILQSTEAAVTGLTYVWLVIISCGRTVTGSGTRRMSPLLLSGLRRVWLERRARASGEMKPDSRMLTTHVLSSQNMSI